MYKSILYYKHIIPPTCFGHSVGCIKQEGYISRYYKFVRYFSTFTRMCICWFSYHISTLFFQVTMFIFYQIVYAISYQICRKTGNFEKAAVLPKPYLHCTFLHTDPQMAFAFFAYLLNSKTSMNCKSFKIKMKTK